MMPEEITRAEAIPVFAKRCPGATPAEVEGLFDAWLALGCLDFNRSSTGRLHITLCEPRRVQ
jgi:hypothetical protein